MTASVPAKQLGRVWGMDHLNPQTIDGKHNKNKPNETVRAFMGYDADRSRRQSPGPFLLIWFNFNSSMDT